MRVIVRGGGDLASGTAYKLFQCGFEVILLECEKPTSIRRYVSFSEAVYHGQASVENVWCVKAESIQEVEKILSDKKIALLVDPDGKAFRNFIQMLSWMPSWRKKNLGTRIDMAKIVNWFRSWI